jgi:spore maturation protein SpmB
MNLHTGAQNALTLAKEWLPFIVIASVIMSLFRKERGLGYAISVILLGAVLMFLTEPAMMRGLGHAVVAFLTGTAK